MKNIIQHKLYICERTIITMVQKNIGIYMLQLVYKTKINGILYKRKMEKSGSLKSIACKDVNHSSKQTVE